MEDFGIHLSSSQIFAVYHSFIINTMTYEAIPVRHLWLFIRFIT